MGVEESPELQHPLSTYSITIKNMGELTTEESIDQPLEESQDDQTDVEETKDQPETEEVEESEESIEIDGSLVPLSELKQGYMRQKDYTQKTQSLADQRKQIEELKASFAKTEEQRPLTPEEKQVQDFIEQFGIVTKDKLDSHLRVQEAKTKDMQEFEGWRRGAGVSNEIAETVRDLGKVYTNLTYSEIYEKAYGSIKQKKIVSRKVVGIKGKGSPQQAESTAITREKIAQWVKDGTYSQHSKEVMDALAKGEIK